MNAARRPCGRRSVTAPVSLVQAGGVELTESAQDEVPQPERKGQNANAGDKISPGVLLLIEDDKEVRDVIRLMLEKAGYSVLSAATAQEGISVMDRQAHQVKLAIVDLTLPDREGRDTVRQLRELNPGLEVICTSGHTAEAAAPLMAGLQRVDFLSKPFTFAVLIDTVRRHMEKPSAP